MSESLSENDEFDLKRPRSLGSPHDQTERHPIDNIGLQEPNGKELELQEEVSYEISAEPKFTPTRALFIGNLTRPINSIDFQNVLKDLAAPHFIERAWLSRLRTHGIILVSETEGAVSIREKLNGVRYPSEEEDLRFKEEHDMKQLQNGPENPPTEFNIKRKELYVDFIPVKAINQWIFEEDRGPRDGKWKIFFEDNDGEIYANHKLLSGGHVPRYIAPRGRGRGRGWGFRGGYRGDYGRRPVEYRPTDSYTPGSKDTDDSERDRSRSKDYPQREHQPRPYYPRDYPPREYRPRGDYHRGDEYVPRGRDSHYRGGYEARTRETYALTDSYQPGKANRDGDDDRISRNDSFDRTRNRSRSPGL